MTANDGHTTVLHSHGRHRAVKVIPQHVTNIQLALNLETYAKSPVGMEGEIAYTLSSHPSRVWRY